MTGRNFDYCHDQKWLLPKPSSICYYVCVCVSVPLSQQETAAEPSAVQPSNGGCTKVQLNVFAPLLFSNPVQVRLERMASSVGGSILKWTESVDRRVMRMDSSYNRSQV